MAIELTLLLTEKQREALGSDPTEKLYELIDQFLIPKPNPSQPIHKPAIPIGFTDSVTKMDPVDCNAYKIAP